MRKIFPVLALLAVSFCAIAQESEQAAGAGTSAAAASGQQLSSSEPGTLIGDETIPRGARVFVAPIENGFDNYIIAGLQKKKVPVVVVTDSSAADYEISGVSESEAAGWAKMLFLGSEQSSETASIKMVNLNTGRVVFAYAVHKSSSARGKQTAGEACAKHIREKIR